MHYFEIQMISNGKKVMHHLQAVDKKDAIFQVGQSLPGTIMKIKEVPLPLNLRFEKYTKLLNSRKKSVKVPEFVVVLRQLAVMTNAGISLRESLFEAANATTDPHLARIIKEAMDDIDSGLNLSTSLQRFEKDIGSISIALIETGEQTGRLADSFSKLANILEQSSEKHKKMKKALRMPIMTSIALIGSFIFLILVVVPKFKSIFSKFGSDLPWPTQLLLTMEYALSHFGLYMLAVLVGAFMAHKNRYANAQSYRYKFDKFILRFYLIGDIIKLSMLSRFNMIIAELLQAGIPLTDAIHTATNTIDNAYFKELFSSIIVSIQRGHSLSEALAETEIFEAMTIQMTKTGERGGQLDEMLAKVADYYEMRFQRILDNLSSMIEPILMVVVAIMVMILALGIFMPMWDMSSAVKG
jgi:type II secretory pathway component PulF